jgi:hypothetical protein
MRVFAGNLPYKRAGLRRYVSKSGSSIRSCRRALPDDSQTFRYACKGRVGDDPEGTRMEARIGMPSRHLILLKLVLTPRN